ncbi:MAG: hypothetical protein SGPRY_005050 [Prymnesium sp.]
MRLSSVPPARVASTLVSDGSLDAMGQAAGGAAVAVTGLRRVSEGAVAGLYGGEGESKDQGAFDEALGTLMVETGAVHSVGESEGQEALDTVEEASVQAAARVKEDEGQTAENRTHGEAMGASSSAAPEGAPTNDVPLADSVQPGLAFEKETSIAGSHIHEATEEVVEEEDIGKAGDMEEEEDKRTATKAQIDERHVKAQEMVEMEVKKEKKEEMKEDDEEEEEDDDDDNDEWGVVDYLEVISPCTNAVQLFN